ncbi:hypothetical protein ANACOL_03748 [Anaerotruncus colihominis DSM 17241]|uniref:Uncharacterized protein n=1 Tax=Anaerotruncus colihominis DSM 17241 TaxID=445972 RepID=B0PG16_9FIRM|nr:hypothetical protein ANACOL_03748 [Anaerotruncus colihominis DSM 17241]
MRRAEGRSRGLSAPGGYSRRKAPNSRPGKRSGRRWATRARVARAKRKGCLIV